MKYICGIYIYKSFCTIACTCIRKILIYIYTVLDTNAEQLNKIIQKGAFFGGVFLEYLQQVHDCHFSLLHQPEFAMLDVQTFLHCGSSIATDSILHSYIARHRQACGRLGLYSVQLRVQVLGQDFSTLTSRRYATLPGRRRSCPQLHHERYNKKHIQHKCHLVLSTKIY